MKPGVLIRQKPDSGGGISGSLVWTVPLHVTDPDVKSLCWMSPGDVGMVVLMERTSTLLLVNGVVGWVASAYLEAL